MTMYTREKGVFSIVTDNTNPELTEYVIKLAQSYTDLEIQKTKCGYACSDHASWYKAGYSSAFPFETPFGDHNPNIHTANDVISKLDLEHGKPQLKSDL